MCVFLWSIIWESWAHSNSVIVNRLEKPKTLQTERKADDTIRWTLLVIIWLGAIMICACLHFQFVKYTSTVHSESCVCCFGCGWAMFPNVCVWSLSTFRFAFIFVFSHHFYMLITDHMKRKQQQRSIASKDAGWIRVGESHQIATIKRDSHFFITKIYAYICRCIYIYICYHYVHMRKNNL